MIKAIRMKNCASYANSIESLSNLTKINFVYGANGSGKSIIGNFLQDQANQFYEDCEIEWDAGIEQEVKVYNRNFKVDNFKGDIDGVFTLGQASINELNELNDLKKKRENLVNKIKDLNFSLEDKKNESEKNIIDFKEQAWNSILKNYEDDFSEVFAGLRGSKDKFFGALQDRLPKFPIRL